MISWVLEAFSFLKLDRKTLLTYALVAGGAVVAYLGWKYVSAQSAAKNAATAMTNQETAEATATAHVLAGQVQDGALSQSLATSYPATAGAVTSSPTGVGTVAPVSAMPIGSVIGSPVPNVHASGGNFLGGISNIVTNP